MVLYIAISGKTKTEVIDNLRHFMCDPLNNFRHSNCIGEHHSPHASYGVDYSFEAKDDQAQLANLMPDIS